MSHRLHRVEWGAGNDRKRTSAANWREPFKWNSAAKAAGKTATVFCLSLGDIWDNEVDPIWRRDALEVMERTPNLIYLLLSKRIGNAAKMCSPFAGHPGLPPNAALGATMIDQAEWDRDLPKLLDSADLLGAAFTFASVEPMLGPIRARGTLPSWVIVGGESGEQARPMRPDWVRSLRDECVAAGVPFHLKQWGEWHADALAYTDMQGRNPPPNMKIGKRKSGALLDGREWRQMPGDTHVE